MSGTAGFAACGNQLGRLHGGGQSIDNRWNALSGRNCGGLEEQEAASDTDLIELDELPEQSVTAREATAGFKIFQRFVEENPADPVIMQMSDKFDEVKKMKPKNLFDYFTRAS